MTLVDSKLDYGSLPVINDKLVGDYYLDFEKLMEPAGAGWGWTQDAVDFACLVTGNLSDKIIEQAQRIEELQGKLDSINTVIFASGASLGTEEYFAIRKLATNAK